MTTSNPLCLAGLGLWAFASASLAQVAINTDGSDPDASAMLDVTSNGKGVLIPRLTNAERDAITTPATGLMIYSTTDQSFSYYDGAAWQPIGKAGDNDATNELQTISVTDDTLSLTDGGSIDLSPYMDNTDGQDLSLNNNTLSITGGNGISLLPYLDNTDDQQLSLNDDTLSLTNGGSVDLSSYGGFSELTGNLDTNGFFLQGDDAVAGTGVRIESTGHMAISIDPLGLTGFDPFGMGLNVEEGIGIFDSQIEELGTWLFQIDNLSFSLGGPGVSGGIGPLVSSEPEDFYSVFLTAAGSFSFLTFEEAPAGGLSTVEHLRVGDGLGAEVFGGLAVNGLSTLNGGLRITDGSPEAGQVWTATDSLGTGSWQDATAGSGGATLVKNGFHTRSFANASRLDGEGRSGWTRVPNYTTTASNLSNGDVLLVLVSFRFQVDGSAEDSFDFRVEAAGGWSGTSQDTGGLEYLRDSRGDWYQISFHRVMTVNSAVSGNVDFRLQLNLSGTDDECIFNDLNMTIIKLQ